MSSTIIGLIVLGVGIIISVFMTPKENMLKKNPTKGSGLDVYSGDREF